MNRFVTVILHGGLGNQLYQYAFGRALSIKHNCKLNLDISIYDTIHNTFKFPFMLDSFKIHNDVIISKKFSSLQIFNLRLITKLYKSHIINLKLSKFIFNPHKKIFFEVDFKKQKKNMLEVSDTNAIFFGYWQTIEYFSHIKDLLNNELIPKENLDSKISILSKKIITTNSIAVHIRGGDMEDDSNYTFVEDDYYFKAINFFEKKYGKISLNIMTDDIDLARKQISKIIRNKEIDIFFFKDLKLTDVEEFLLFKSHKNFIISRSTFSWWSSYLSSDQNKTILLPSEWYIGENTLNGRIAENMLII